MKSFYLEQAILETLAYSDIFDYPLTLDELHRYLSISVSKSEIHDCLQTLNSVNSAEASSVSPSLVYFLANRPEIVAVREERTAASRTAFQRALFYGRLLGQLPFVRMVAMTGSLAVLNLSKNADMDFMLVTQPNRLWLARACAVTFGRFMRLFGDRICVNLLVSENALAWPLHDLYSAREMGQMIPIMGMEVYRRLRAANSWTDSFLPNASSAPTHTPSTVKETGSALQRLLEYFLRGRLGAWLEEWAMTFQLAKIARQYGNGLEANFSADLCQGNFHDHRTWADEYFQARLVSLGLAQPLPSMEEILR